VTDSDGVEGGRPLDSKRFEDCGKKSKTRKVGGQGQRSSSGKSLKNRKKRRPWIRKQGNTGIFKYVLVEVSRVRKWMESLGFEKVNLLGGGRVGNRKKYPSSAGGGKKQPISTPVQPKGAKHGRKKKKGRTQEDSLRLH